MPRLFNLKGSQMLALKFLFPKRGERGAESGCRRRAPAGCAGGEPAEGAGRRRRAAASGTCLCGRARHPALSTAGPLQPGARAREGERGLEGLASWRGSSDLGPDSAQELEVTAAQGRAAAAPPPVAACSRSHGAAAGGRHTAHAAAAGFNLEPPGLPPPGLPRALLEPRRESLAH